MEWCLGDVKRKQLTLMPFSTKGVPQIPPDKMCCYFYNNQSMHTSDIIIIYFLIKNMKYLDLQKCKEFSCVTRCFMDNQKYQIGLYATPLTESIRIAPTNRLCIFADVVEITQLTSRSIIVYILLIYKCYVNLKLKYWLRDH